MTSYRKRTIGLLLLLPVVGMGTAGFWLGYPWLGIGSVAGVVLIARQLFQLADRSDRELAGFLDSIRFDDLSRSFPEQQASRSRQELHRAYNTIIGRFRELKSDREGERLFLQAVIEQIDTALLCLDEADEVILWNRGARELFHRSYLPGLATLAQIDPALLEIVGTIQPGDRRSVNLNIQNKNARVSVRMRRIQTRDHEYRVYAFYNIDAELEEGELLAWQKLIRILNHEIMNSVTPIVSLAGTMEELLRRPLDAEDTEDLRLSIAAIRKRGEGLLRFSQSYRQLTRIPPPEIQSVSVYEMLDRLKPLLQTHAREKQVTLEFLKPAVDLQFPADPELLAQVLLNLGYNAIDATAGLAGGQVTCSAQRAADQRVVFTIADNGTGIDAELLGKIFVPFFTTKKEGSGIGLSVSRQIIRMHGGRLRVRSRQGEGTVMEVELGM